jgi:CubicO group peptidase (beta-lactamase class C family)
LGIKTPPWQWIGKTGVIYAGGDQRLTPREMLKFGVLYLNMGIWDDRQIVPEYWIENSANPYSGPDNTWVNYFLRSIPPGSNAWGLRGYSYSWWTQDFTQSGQNFPAYWGLGWGGQKIIILPDQDTVVVFTGANYTSADPTIKILKKYIIPAFNHLTNEIK